MHVFSECTAKSQQFAWECHICIDLQLSRSALTFIAQKTSAQPQPCKRCSQLLRDKHSGDSINVYHGEPCAAKLFGAPTNCICSTTLSPCTCHYCPSMTAWISGNCYVETWYACNIMFQLASSSLVPRELSFALCRGVSRSKPLAVC